jgi:cytochrome c5
VIFLAQAKSSVLDAHDVPEVKTTDNVDSISASVMEAKPAGTEDENGSPEGIAGMPVDKKTGKDVFNALCVLCKVSV